MQQVGKDGKSPDRQDPGQGRNKAPDLSLVRMAPPDIDPGQDLGLVQRHPRTRASCCPTGRNNRKSGSIVMYDSTHVEVARFNFTNGWPSKISTDQLSVDSNDPVKETITLTIESPRAGQVSLTTQYEFTLPARVCRPRGRGAPRRV